MKAPEEWPLPPAEQRPTMTTPLVVELATSMAMEKLKASFPRLAEYGQPTESDSFSLKLHLSHAMSHRDGFRIGKDLENRGWYVSGDVVAVLHEPWLERALSLVTERWVSTHEIKPKHAAADVVRIMSAGELVEGEVISVDTARGLYVVRVAAHGHDERTGYSVAFEKIQP